MKLSASLCRILLVGVAILGLTWAGAILAQRPVQEVTAPSNTTIVIVQQHDPGALREFVLLCRNAGEQQRDASNAVVPSDRADPATGYSIAECTEVK